MIEKGRHQGLEENQKICPTCQNGIETEQHFLLECVTFRAHREKLMVEIANISPTFSEMNENDKFVHLLKVGQRLHDIIFCLDEKSIFAIPNNSFTFQDILRIL